MASDAETCVSILTTFTGERIIPDDLYLDDVLFQRHLAAYKFIAKYIKAETKILDAGCGEGYGSDFLSTKCRKIVGVDIAIETIENARRRYRQDNLEFLVTNSTNLCFPDNIFDVVCSFQVIEHIEDYQRYLGELKRVLVPHGFIILSTPNKITSPPGNPYHIKEFYPDELTRTMQEYFSKCELLGLNPTFNLGEAIVMTIKLDIIGIASLKRLIPKSIKRAILKGVSIIANKEYKLRQDVCAENFKISKDDIISSLDLIAVCQK